jgi:DprA winged helix domain
MHQVTPAHSYRSGLTRHQLLAELRQLLAQARAVDRLICRYLADLADAVEQDATFLIPHADVYHLAKTELGLALRQTRERIRIGRSLRELPAIEQAFVSGQLSYSRTREITRVAEPADEHQWLAAATDLPMRSLERRVAEASAHQLGDGTEPSSDDRRREAEPAQMHHLTPDVIELRVTLPAEVAALLQRAMQGAKRASGRSLSDADTLEAVARDALAAQDAGDSDPRRTVVLYECRHCETSELETGVEPAELRPAVAASLSCGAKVVDLETAGRQVKRGGPMPAAVKNAVLLRDRCRCRVPGCHLRRYVDVHHLVEQCKGGAHSRRNCVTLCTRHHQWLHAGKLRIEGNGDGELVFHDAAGERMWDRFAATQRGSGNEAATQGGSPSSAATRRGSCNDDATHAATQGGSPNGDAPTTHQTKLLAALGRRGGWTPDALCEATGLRIQDAQVALTYLTLAGRIAQDAGGRFAPCG